jgi:multidrug resistance protein
MADLDNDGVSEMTSKPREQSHIPLDLMTTISRGTRYNTAEAKDKSLRRTTSAQIPLDLIKTLSRSTTRDAANKADIERQLDLEAADHSHDISGRSSPTLTGDDNCSRDTDNDESGGKNVLHFSHNDPTNPYCFSALRKTAIVLTGMLIVVNSAMGSSVASGISSEMTDYFGITSKTQLVLPTSIYIVGYVLGPLVFSPLSETFGRKIVMISTFVVYTAFTLGCALAPTWAGLIVMRLLAGIGASTPNSVVGGIYADIFSTPRERGRVIALYMTCTTFGPLIGPIASGYIGVISWRWAYWLMLILAGVTWPPLLLMPETYGPIVLKKKAQAMRKQGQTILAPIELDPPDVYQMVVVILTRPVRMFLFESIVLFSCLYTALIYAIFYSKSSNPNIAQKQPPNNPFPVFLQAYPIIYTGVYGFSAGERGLAFLGIGIGSVIAFAIYLAWDYYLAHVGAQPTQPQWFHQEEYRRVPLACLAAPLLVLSMFWLGWTAKPSIHWIVPMAAAIPFGIAYLLIFMALLNYIVDAYEIFSASAMAAASCSRSILAVALPFATTPMYDRLGIAWACSTLGFIGLLLGVIPFMFLRYGAAIRKNSKFCQELAAKKAAQGK